MAQDENGKSKLHELREAALRVREETGLWVMDIFFDSPYHGLALFEVTVRRLRST